MTSFIHFDGKIATLKKVKLIGISFVKLTKWYLHSVKKQKFTITQRYFVKLMHLHHMHDLIHIINENVDFKEFVREKTRNYLLSKILREDNFLLKTVAFTKFL